MTYSERLCAAQAAALEPGDYYYADGPDDEDEAPPEEDAP